MRINIAIDGPSAAGKSTIAKKLAAKLGYVHMDTGAMYRCTAFKAIKEGISLEDEMAVVDMLNRTEIKLTPEGKVFLDGEEVTNLIRANEISMGASKVSQLKDVRAKLVSLQQEMAKDKGIIMDGRDIGTVVLKDAEVKVFMTATAEARAMRRYLENQQKGIPSDLQALTDEIAKRDYDDTHREHSPLRKAEDAVELDSSNLSIDEVVEKMCEIMRMKGYQV